MNKKSIKKLSKHLFIIFIIACIGALLLSMAAKIAPSPSIADFEAWGWCEGFDLNDCEYYLHTNDGLSGRIFRHYFVGFFWVLFVLVSVIYGLILWLKWLWKIFMNKVKQRN